MVIKFAKERETKNAIRYNEVDAETGEAPDQPAIGALYIKKWYADKLGITDLTYIEVVVQAAEEEL